MMYYVWAVVFAVGLIAATGAVHAGPITFNSALPVSEGIGILRSQVQLVRKSRDSTAQDRALAVTAVPVVLAYGVSPKLAVFGVLPYVEKRMDITMGATRIRREAKGLGDALGSVAAIVAGVVILLTGWMQIDPILSFLIAGILAWGGWRLVRETTLELMEGVPPEVNVQGIEGLMLQMDGVSGVHHVHVWKLPDAQMAMSAHVQVKSMNDWPSILPRLLEMLTKQDVKHATLQPEILCQDNKGRCHGH